MLTLLAHMRVAIHWVAIVGLVLFLPMAMADEVDSDQMDLTTRTIVALMCMVIRLWT